VKIKLVRLNIPQCFSVCKDKKTNALLKSKSNVSLIFLLFSVYYINYISVKIKKLYCQYFAFLVLVNFLIILPLYYIKNLFILIKLIKLLKLNKEIQSNKKIIIYRYEFKEFIRYKIQD